MKRRDSGKRLLATAVIIASVGALTFGGLGARAVDTTAAFISASFFGGPAAEAEATIDTCAADIKAAWKVYSAALAPIMGSSITEHAAEIATAEGNLTDGVAAASCPASADNARTAFVTANRYYVLLLGDVAAGTRKTSEPTFREAQSATLDTWGALLTAVNLVQR